MNWKMSSMRFSWKVNGWNFTFKMTFDINIGNSHKLKNVVYLHPCQSELSGDEIWQEFRLWRFVPFSGWMDEPTSKIGIVICWNLRNIAIFILRITAMEAQLLTYHLFTQVQPDYHVLPSINTWRPGRNSLWGEKEARINIHLTNAVN